MWASQTSPLRFGLVGSTDLPRNGSFLLEYRAENNIDLSAPASPATIPSAELTEIRTAYTNILSHGTNADFPFMLDQVGNYTEQDLVVIGNHQYNIATGTGTFADTEPITLISDMYIAWKDDSSARPTRIILEAGTSNESSHDISGLVTRTQSLAGASPVTSKFIPTPYSLKQKIWEKEVNNNKKTFTNVTVEFTGQANISGKTLDLAVTDIAAGAREAFINRFPDAIDNSIEIKNTHVGENATAPSAVALKAGVSFNYTSDDNVSRSTVIVKREFLKLGNTLDVEHIFKVFQALNDRFYLLLPKSKNNDGTYVCDYVYFGETLCQNEDTTFTTDNFFISDIHDDEIVDVDLVKNKFIYSTKKGRILFTKTDEEHILSNPIKALINNRDVTKQSYGGVVNPGTHPNYAHTPTAFYQDFLDAIPQEGSSFTQADALGFGLSYEEQDIEIRQTIVNSAVLRSNNSFRIYCFTNKGVYLLSLSGIDSSFTKLSSFVSAEDIEILPMEKSVVYTDGEALFITDLSASNNVTFDLQRTALGTENIFNKNIQKLVKVDEETLFIRADNRLYRAIVEKDQILGISEYVFSKSLVDVQDHGFLLTDGVYQFSDTSQEMFNCYGELNPFSISNFFPAHGLYYDRDLKDIFVIKDKDLVDLTIGLTDQDWEKNLLIFDEEDNKIEQTFFKVSSIGLVASSQNRLYFKQPNSETGRLYGFSIAGNLRQI